MSLEETHSSSGLGHEAPVEPTNTDSVAPAPAPIADATSAEAASSVSEEPPKPIEAGEPTTAAEVEAAPTPEASDSAEIGNLLAGIDQLSRVAPGQTVRATVLKVTDTDVIVDIGLKSEAALPRAEFLADDGTLTVNPGDLVDVLIESYDEEEGAVTASRQKVVRLRAWEEIETAFRDQGSVQGVVRERTKGGLQVDLSGVRAFLPASQTDMRPLRNLDSLVGKQVFCKVVKLDRRRNNVVVSRKAAMEEEFARRRKELVEKLNEGAILTGRVKNLVDYGAFIDLGGMDGLLHITDLTWGRVAHPSEVVQVGQELQVKVLKYVPEKERVSLGLKQLQPDPWEQAASDFKPGDRTTRRVVSLTDYGAFVELAPGVEGLIHVSEMTWSKRLKHPSKIMSVGDLVEVAVLDVKPAQRRISLSLRQTLPDPWTTLAERLAPGAVVEGRVRNLTDFGAFVEVEEGVDGLIHLSDLSWTRRVKHPSEMLKKGQRIEAVILGLDSEHRRLSLGLKQLQPDVWETFFAKTRVGDVLRGKVARMAPFGAFVELEEGIEGLCHVSEMGGDDGHHAGVGRELRFRVIRLNPGEKRVGLSLNNVEQEERHEAAAPVEGGGDNGNVAAETKAAPEVPSKPEQQPAPVPTAESEPALGNSKQLSVASGQ